MVIDPDRFFADMLADCMTTALASQWRDRAQRFRDARPRAGDFPGQRTVEELRDDWRRLTALAARCEAHADLLDEGHAVVRTLMPEVDVVLGEAA